MKKIIPLLGSLILLIQITTAQNPKYVTVVAQKGDGIYSLLNQYMAKNSCNLSHFYQINGLRKGAGLRLGKSYKLPIYEYTYNGRSIRSTLGRNDLDWAKGVQAYNEALHSAKIKPGDYRKDKKLWISYSHLNCPEQKLEGKPKAEVASINPDKKEPIPNVRGQKLRGTYPIFGSKYAKVPLENNSLKGCVYYVVSGHGGPDPGAVGKYAGKELCEDEYAYDVGLRLAWNLLSYGATVYMITRDDNDGIRQGEILPCDKDEKCWVKKPIPRSQSLRLQQRSDVVNRLYTRNRKNGVRYQRLIVIHVDSDSRNEKIDMFFYHRQNDKESQLFSKRIQKTIKEKYELYRKGRGYKGTVSGRDLHMLRETKPTAVFVELGNIRNPNDQVRLVREKNRQLVANWMFQGLISDAKKK
ncbi:MAG: N-acetylmuramoyl-L-alanine amidase [Bacteroidia bacterium]|nr:N-acetylmuramoyl-L-alanine amidase [Bacteroidia bacterium]